MFACQKCYLKIINEASVEETCSKTPRPKQSRLVSEYPVFKKKKSNEMSNVGKK